jgi:iron complex outermembrane receptor protein
MKRNRRNLALAGYVLVLIMLTAGVGAQETEVSDPEEKPKPMAVFEGTVTVGTRVEGRSSTETTAPIDVISVEALTRNGYADLGEVLQLLAPSFNLSRTQISDSSDLFRPATLRGLHPDQVLVLINGKRRHTQAVLSLPNTVGGGAAGTDMNAIPLSAIESIEVLRDGAAAQYGSDAIAGVINIKLKTASEGSQIDTQTGAYYEGDGETFTVSANTGFKLGDDGFFNLSAEFRQGDTTNRADGSPFAGGQVRFQVGEADRQFTSLFFNMGIPIGKSTELYSFGGYSTRDALGAGFFRRVDQADRAVPQVYPEGFLPRIDNEARDYSFAAGVKRDFSDSWTLDTSVVLGSNRYSFNSQNTINASIAGEYLLNNPGASDADVAANAGPREGFSGAIEFDQLTLNVDMHGQVDWGWNDVIYTSFGFEYRDESYRLTPGDLASYSCGASSPLLVNIPSVSDPDTPANCGFQAFPGLRPETKTNTARDSYAFYLDFENNLTDEFLLGLAVRFEDYGDVGDETSGKLSFRYKTSEDFAFRGAVSTGFRAPSLQQLSYSAVTTTLGSGGLTQSLLAPVGSPLPTALGVDNLDIESSSSFSLGFVWEPSDHLLVTVDAYSVAIDDRIILGGFLTEDSLRAAGLDAAADIIENSGVQQVNFFSNSIDTKTKGLELVVDYNAAALGGYLDITFALSFNETEVQAINAPTGVDESVILTTAARTGIELGQPQERGNLTFDWGNDKWSLLSRFNYFGETQEAWFTAIGNGIPESVAEFFGVDTSTTHVIDSAVLVDLEISYQLNNHLKLALGANNVFDKRPDELVENDFQRAITEPFPAAAWGGTQTFGGFRYPLRAVSYGFNGGFYYLKASYRF